MTQEQLDETLEAAWHNGDDVPTDEGEDGAVLAASWPGTPFVAGDLVEYDVWPWFDRHSRGVAWLMYELPRV